MRSCCTRPLAPEANCSPPTRRSFCCARARLRPVANAVAASASRATSIRTTAIIVPDPELKLGQISVDQVRDLAQQLALSSHEGAGTVVLIKPAHALNRFSSNALLKTLEEPRPGVLLILLTSSPSLLPATLRSRCLRLRLPAPDRESALAWLQAQRPRRT